MLTVQPPMIPVYFSRKNKFLSHAFSQFYLSWEDALWHLLRIYSVEPGSTILVPEFFCDNVEDHMREHGLVIATYPVDKYLHIGTQSFIAKLKETKPAIVVVFHPVGIANSLMSDSAMWIEYLSVDIIIIEDCVHKIIDHTKISFLSDRHFLIDSLRKVVPIQGSHIYSPVELPRIPNWQSILTLPYRLSVTAYWAIMQTYLLLAHSSKSEALRHKYNLKAERAMIQGYEVIGSRKMTSPGMRIMERLSRTVNIEGIKASKKWQAKMYLEGLKTLLKSELFWLPKVQSSDYDQLRGFPLIIDIKIADKFLMHIREYGVLVRFELDDSKWSKKQKIVYLPMGIHLNRQDINEILRIVIDHHKKSPV